METSIRRGSSTDVNLKVLAAVLSVAREVVAWDVDTYPVHPFTQLGLRARGGVRVSEHEGVVGPLFCLPAHHRLRLSLRRRDHLSQRAGVWGWGWWCRDGGAHAHEHSQVFGSVPWRSKREGSASVGAEAKDQERRGPSGVPRCQGVCLVAKMCA